MSTFQTLALDLHEGVATLWLDRPEVRNAFDERLIAEITQAMESLGSDPAVRVVVVGGRGPSFCSGADLNWMARMAQRSEPENQADAMCLARMLQTLHACPKPTIARVHGDCYAGGLGLVAACDVAIATESAQFCLREVRVGLIPATIGPYVIRAMGPRAATRYMLTAERFDAAEAARTGLVHKVVAPEDLDSEIIAFARAITAGGPQALAESKRLITDLALRRLGEAVLQDTAQRIARVRASAEGREGVRAVLEKRRPSWSIARES